MPLLGAVGIKGAQAVGNLAQNVVDVTSGKKISASLKEQGIKAAKRLGNEMIFDTLNHVSGSLGSRRKTATRRSSGPSLKRAASSKTKVNAKHAKFNF